jgi:NAD+ synthetase
LIRDIAEEQGVFVAYANLVGSEGGKSFFGSSTVCGPTGDVRVRAPVWDEAIVSITIDLDDLTRARADSPLLSDLRTALPHLLGTIERIEAGVPAETTWDAAVRAGGEERGANASAGARGAPPRSQHATARTADHHPSTASSIPVVHVPLDAHGRPPALDIDAVMAESWLLEFLRDEFARRGFRDAVVGVSGGVDSAVVAYLAARALGPEHVVGVRLPYRTSSPESLSHAQLVIDTLGIQSHTIDITNAVDGYLCTEPDADAARRGNVMARTRMIALFDMSAKHHALPLGTGNKTERLLGYFTWHADDSPPVNPIGDLYKTQVWQLARHLGVPDVIVNKPASADLISGQTDEGDFGISYARADVILNWLLYGYTPADLVARGFDADEIALVRKRLEGTHWKRRLPAVAMMSSTAIGESYLRPVDY